MKKCIILLLMIVVLLFVGCSKTDEQSEQAKAKKKEKLSEEAKNQNNNITINTDDSSDKDNISREMEISIDKDASNRKAVAETYRLSIPASFKRVDHNDHIYVYDSNGNSLNVTNQATKIKVDDYSEENCHKLLSSSYNNVELIKIEHLEELKQNYYQTIAGVQTVIDSLPLDNRNEVFTNGQLG